MTERMRITADGMTISRDKDGNVQWIQVEGVTLVRKQRAEKAEQTIKEISELPRHIGTNSSGQVFSFIDPYELEAALNRSKP